MYYELYMVCGIPMATVYSSSTSFQVLQAPESWSKFTTCDFLATVVILHCEQGIDRQWLNNRTP